MYVKDCGMNYEQAKAAFEKHESEIRAMGVLHLALFGSTVRGDTKPDSDVDVLVDIDRDRKFSLIDHASLQIYLTDILGRQADVSMRDGLRPYLKENILGEAVGVF